MMRTGERAPTRYSCYQYTLYLERTLDLSVTYNRLPALTTPYSSLQTHLVAPRTVLQSPR